jgi:hypothetical protein
MKDEVAGMSEAGRVEGRVEVVVAWTGDYGDRVITFMPKRDREI